MYANEMAVRVFSRSGNKHICGLYNGIISMSTAIPARKPPDTDTIRNSNTNNSTTGVTGSNINKNVTIQSPLDHHDYFNVRNSFTLKDLFANRVHFGHKSVVRNEYTKPFLFGCRLGVDIIDLEQTVSLLGDALNFTAHIAFRQGIIMFITRSPQNIPMVEQMALDCGEYSHCRKWRLGTFTNSTVQYGLTTRLPDLCIFLSTLDDIFEQHTAVVEAAKMNIPVVGIVDSNCDPRLITYPVPGNDDTPTSIKFFMNLFTNAIMKGKQAFASINQSSSEIITDETNLN